MKAQPYQLRRIQNSLRVIQRKLAILAKELDEFHETNAWVMCLNAANNAGLAVKHLETRIAEQRDKRGKHQTPSEQNGAAP